MVEKRRRMSEETLAVRVENHERRLELLEALPARVSAVELQIVQLRIEMHEQFSATRQEFAAADSGLREEIRALGTDLRAEIKVEGEAIRTELRKEIRDGDEETRRYMRVLHEEVLSRIAIIQKGLPRRRKR
jgi:hypothetical protein